MTQYINGEELIKCFTNEYGLTYLVENTDVVRIIKEMPAEDVQPIIHGKWLNVSKTVRDDYLGDVNFAECSVCHSIRVADYFCSCCGADMRKIDESVEEE